MSEERASVRYCAMFQMDKATDMKRVMAIAPAYVDLVKGWSKGEMEVLCRSNDGQLFAYLFRSTKPADMIRSEFDNWPGSLNKDSMVLFAVEPVGTRLTTNRAEIWLQRH